MLLSNSALRRSCQSQLSPGGLHTRDWLQLVDDPRLAHSAIVRASIPLQEGHCLGVRQQLSNCARGCAHTRRAGSRHGRQSSTTLAASPAESVPAADHSTDPASPPQQTEQASQQRQGSSWNAKEANSLNKNDFLANLGKAQDYNINVDHGQNSNFIDSLFTGKTLGAKSDIADGTLRGYEFRKFDNLVGDYYVAPAFLEAVAVHLVKNYIAESFDRNARVPLILGIWGGKGQGKTFQTELAFKKMGVETIVMSAGEMESDRAGAPGFMIRQRYRQAAQRAKARGKLTCLFINDIDAGIGHFANTQFTVNNQLVHATLMAICDDPNRVSVAAGYKMDDYIQRVPIIVTANDLSYLFAPLVREGRMEKFYWKPTRVDLENILWQMYKEDGLQKADMGALLDAFPGQSLDFFGALRSATYDGQIREWIENSVGKGHGWNDDAALAAWASKLARKQGLPVFDKVDMRVDDLLKEGRRLVKEQDAIRSLRLSDEYLKKMKTGKSLIGLQG